MNSINSIYFVLLFFVLRTASFAQYNVGNDDGFSYSCYTQADNLAIYSVGNDDGFSYSCYTQGDPSIYSVGNDDGFAYSCYTQGDPSIYSVGNDDGFSFSCYTQDESGIYSVGNDDGFSFSCVGSIGDEAPLPIELLFFDATSAKDNNGKYYVRCNWSTASETNNDYFTVERSRDIKFYVPTYSQIGTVKGAGNSSTTLYYDFNDEYPYTGLSYYRLKQTDYDGKFSYSKIVAVYIGEMDIINISPSPAEKEIEYTIKISETATAEVKVMNMLGQEVIHTTETIEKGVTQKKIDISMLASGFYMLSINTERLGKTEKKFAVK